DLHGDHARLGHVNVGHLVERHHAAIGVDLHRPQQAGRCPPGSQPTELLAQHFDRAIHAAPEILQQFIFGHGVSSLALPRTSYCVSSMIVKRPRPCTTSANPPFSNIEKTRIGMRFSRANEIADASITSRSRANTSRSSSRSKRCALRCCSGSETST